MEIRFIGDVHRKWTRFKNIIKDCDRSLQVGDFGVGFINPVTDKPYSGPPYDCMTRGEHFFIRGNHDNPAACKRHKLWIPDGGIAFGDDRFFCLGGSLSIDKDRRTQGYDWWPDEELQYGQLVEMIDLYEERKPRFVVTHDCPTNVIALVMNIYDDGCRTRKALQNMFEIHKPDLWVHGHFHHDYHMVYKGTEFLGLGELSAVDIEIG